MFVPVRFLGLYSSKRTVLCSVWFDLKWWIFFPLMLHRPSGAIVPLWTSYVIFRIYLRQHWAFLFLRFYTVIFVSQEPHQGFWALFQVPWTRETKNLILSFCQCCVFDTWCKPAILMFLKVLNRFLIRGAEVARLSVISVRLLGNSGLPFGRVGWAIVLGAPFAAWDSRKVCSCLLLPVKGACWQFVQYCLQAGGVLWPYEWEPESASVLYQLLPM